MKYGSFISAAMLLTLASCGGGSGGGGSLATSDFNEVFEKLKESAPEFGARKKIKSFGVLAQQKAALTNWDNASATFMGLGSDNYNPRDFVGALLNEAQDQSIFERARMPFLMSCCLDILANKTGNLFTAGTQTITFTNAVVGVCGESSDFTGMIGEDITIVVTDLADTTNFDQMIFFDSATNPLFSDSDQWMYIRNNDSNLNFIHVEDGSAGEDGSEISTMSISYDKTTESGVFQFLARFVGNDARLYRIFMDTANDDVRIYAHLFNTGGSTSASINLASTFENQGETALSMSWENQQAPYNVDLTDGNACVSTSDGSITTDNTLSCASKTVLASSGAAALDGAAQALNGANIRTDAAAEDLADNLPTFTDATIISAGIGL